MPTYLWGLYPFIDCNVFQYSQQVLGQHDSGGCSGKAKGVEDSRVVINPSSSSKRRGLVAWQILLSSSMRLLRVIPQSPIFGETKRNGKHSTVFSFFRSTSETKREVQHPDEMHGSCEIDVKWVERRASLAPRSFNCQTTISVSAYSICDESLRSGVSLT